MISISEICDLICFQAELNENFASFCVFSGLLGPLIFNFIAKIVDDCVKSIKPRFCLLSIIAILSCILGATGMLLMGIIISHSDDAIFRFFIPFLFVIMGGLWGVACVATFCGDAINIYDEMVRDREYKIRTKNTFIAPKSN